MIPRVRPFFHQSYIDTVNRFDLSIEREHYLKQISQKLKSNYPSSQAFEFFEYGRSSLLAGLSILDFQENDEILVPCFTCPTVLEPIITKKLKPVLYDLECDFSVNIDQLSKRLTPRTKAVLVTHYFGIPFDFSEIREFADSHGLFLIEDSAQSMGSKTSDTIPGDTGDFSFTSHGVDKPLSIGLGSILIFNNKDYLNNFHEVVQNIRLNTMDQERCSFLSLLYFYMNTEETAYKHHIGVFDFYRYFLLHRSKVDQIYQELRTRDRDLSTLSPIVSDITFSNPIRSLFRNQLDRFTKKKSGIEITTPIRMNCYSLNILNTAIEYLDEVNAYRMKLGSIYSANLSDNPRIVEQTFHEDIPFLRYPIINKTHSGSIRMIIKLRSNGYEVGNFNWSRPLNKVLQLTEKFERSEFIAKNIINLPCYFGMNESDVHKICDVINRS